MRKVLVILLFLCLAVFPVLANSAMDVGGSTDDPQYDYFTNVVKYAANIQEGKYYTTTLYLQPNVDQVLKKLKTDDIFFFQGHCGPGIMGIKTNDNDPDPRYVYAENYPGKQLKGLGLPNMQFVFFNCCGSARTDKTYGNLVSAAYYEGGKCVFGFGDSIERGEPTIVYGQAFWDAADKGAPWDSAHRHALGRLRDDKRTTGHCTENKNNFCGYGTLMGAGGRACSSYLQLTPVATETTTHLSETPIQPADLEATDITLDQAQDIIRAFTGNPHLKVTYGEEPSKYVSIVDNIETYYTLNNTTHRVEYAQIFSWDMLTPKPGKNVSLDESYEIAEKFAQRQYPQLWNTTDKTGIRVERKERRPQDLVNLSYSDSIGWVEEYYYPDKNTPGHITIGGSKSIYISIAPGGEIYTYDENLTPRDESVSLKPDLTEEQAWDIAKKYLLLTDNIKMTDDDKTSYGLWVERSHLEWYFVAKNKEEPFSRGGRITIDAHSGQVILYSPYM